jgi:hypothetical protein
VGEEKMTSVQLLEKLKEFVIVKLSNLHLSKKSTPNADIHVIVPQVFICDVPKKESDSENFPYVLIDVIGGKDDLQKLECDFDVVFMVGIYNIYPQEGKLELLNVIDRLRLELVASEIINEQFKLNSLEFQIVNEQTAPYCFGLIKTNYVALALHGEKYFEKY